MFDSPNVVHSAVGALVSKVALLPPLFIHVSTRGYFSFILSLQSQSFNLIPHLFFLILSFYSWLGEVC